MIDKLRFISRSIGAVIEERDHQRGQSLIIVAFLIVALLAAVGLAVDLGLMYVEKVKIGRAVDAAALAGAQELPDESAAHDRMVEYLQLNGYDENADDFSLGWAFPEESDCLNPPCDHYHLVVSATKQVSLTFMRVLGFQTVDVSAHAIGENANRLDVAIVLDVSGSMDDDTCNASSTMSNGCDQSWWSEIHDIIFEDFEGYNLGDGTTDPDRLCGANSPWSCELPLQVGARNDSNRYSGNYGMTEGDGDDGRFYMYFDASAYDQVEVVLRERTYSAGSSDYNSVWYSRAGGGWTRIMNESADNSWDWHAYLVPAQTSQFGIMFGSRYMEALDYGLWDEISIRGMVNGPEPSGPLAECPGVAGHNDCAGGGFKKQPIWDTLNAADWFINECHIGSGEDAVPCLDPELDQVGLAYYSDDGNAGNHYPNSADSATASELVGGDYSSVTNALWTQFDANGWTNIGDGIYRGCEILSTEEPLHHGRTNAVHVMILLSDGQPNRPCTYNCNDGNPTAVANINSAVDWAVQNGIVIFTISLGSEADPTLMANIAEATGGTHSYAASTDDLIPIFQDIAQHIFLRLVS